MLETEKLDRLFRLLEEMTRSTIGDRKQAPWLLITMWRLKWCSGIGLALTWLALYWQRYGITPPGFPDELVLVVILIFLIIVFGLIFIVSFLCDRWATQRFVPYKKLSRQEAQHRDTELITRLLEFDKATLAYGLLQYRHHLSSLEGRAALLAGDLRKLGIFPLAALIISVATLKEDSNQFFWVGLVVIAVSYYLMALAAFLSRERSHQVIQLLEYAIQD